MLCESAHAMEENEKLTTLNFVLLLLSKWTPLIQHTSLFILILLILVLKLANTNGKSYTTSRAIRCSANLCISAFSLTSELNSRCQVVSRIPATFYRSFGCCCRLDRNPGPVGRSHTHRNHQPQVPLQSRPVAARHSDITCPRPAARHPQVPIQKARCHIHPPCYTVVVRGAPAPTWKLHLHYIGKSKLQPGSSLSTTLISSSTKLSNKSSYKYQKRNPETYRIKDLNDKHYLLVEEYD